LADENGKARGKYTPSYSPLVRGRAKISSPLQGEVPPLRRGQRGGLGEVEVASEARRWGRGGNFSLNKGEYKGV